MKKITNMSRIKETRPVAGGEIVKAYTINSMYADGKIELHDQNGDVYRMDVSEVLKMIRMKDIIFTATKKAKYYHLTLEENE